MAWAMLASAVFSAARQAGDVGLGGVDAGLLGRDGGRGLDVFNGGKGGAGLDVVAFFDVEVRDAAEGGGADVDVGHGLDLASAVDDGDQVLADDFAGGDLGDAGLSVEDAGDDYACQDKDDRDDDNNLFTLIAAFLGPLRAIGDVFGEVDNTFEIIRKQPRLRSVFFPESGLSYSLWGHWTGGRKSSTDRLGVLSNADDDIEEIMRLPLVSGM